MKLTVMIEGQDGVSWADWQRLATLTEELGFEGLLRSDHYLSVVGRGDRAALDAWGTICALANQTGRIRRIWGETEPKPIGLRLVLGGQAKRRAAALAAAHADEYNLLSPTPDQVREKRALLDDRLTLSAMIAFAVGSTDAQTQERLDRIKDLMGHAGGNTWLVGTPETVIAQLRALAEAGLDRVMLQHLSFKDDDSLRLIAAEVLPAVASA